MGLEYFDKVVQGDRVAMFWGQDGEHFAAIGIIKEDGVFDVQRSRKLEA